MTPGEFDRIVELAFARIPPRFRRRMENVSFVVEGEPTPRQLAEAGVRPGATLLGLYRGRPLTRRSVSDGFVLPDQIVIFQRPHERLARDAEHLEKLVEQTVWHEVAHYFGMNERQVRAAERSRRIGKR